MKKVRYILGLFILIVVLTLIINILVSSKSRPYIFSKAEKIPECYTGIVLGTLVSKSGYPSDFLQDRMDVALQLYNSRKIKRLLLTGDHGHKDYDEVNSMKDYLLNHGVKTEDIFLDHAGFDTYNSMVRAREIFKVKDAIIITQAFHLPRAVYIARSKGLIAYGIKADRREYSSIRRLKFREKIACVKAFLEVLIHKKPHFLGDPIPITGDSKLSYDK